MVFFVAVAVVVEQLPPFASKVTVYVAFVIVDNRLLSNDIYVPKEKLNGAQDGQKVIVEMTDWPEKAKNPFGRIIDVLGDAGENETEMHAILAEYGLPYSYPDELVAEAEKIDVTISKKEIDTRFGRE